MTYGARNVVNATVRSVKKGEVMSLVKFDLIDPPETASSVLTSESVEDMDLKPGDRVQLVVNAIHVLPVKN